MKLFVLFFLVGFAAASPLYEYLEEAANEVYDDFMAGMEDAPSLRHAMGLGEEHLAADEAEDDIKTELGKRLRETLDDILEKMKDAIDHGKIVKEDLQNKLQEIKEKMKDMKIDIGNRARELMEKVKQKSKEFFQKLLDTLGVKNDLNKRSVYDEDVRRMDFNLKSLFKQLKKAILKNIDKEKVKEYVEKLFGKTSEMTHSLEKIINEKGDGYKQKILNLIDRFLGEKEAAQIQYSIADYWEKVKEYFKDLHIDLKERYAKFGEWVKEVVKKGLDKSKTKMENIKSIAREFVEHAKGVRKEIAVEALEFLRPYRDDLGSLYDQVRETVKDILKKQD